MNHPWITHDYSPMNHPWITPWAARNSWICRLENYITITSQWISDWRTVILLPRPNPHYIQWINDWRTVILLPRPNPHYIHCSVHTQYTPPFRTTINKYKKHVRATGYDGMRFNFDGLASPQTPPFTTPLTTSHHPSLSLGGSWRTALQLPTRHSSKSHFLRHQKTRRRPWLPWVILRGPFPPGWQYAACSLRATTLHTTTHLLLSSSPVLSSPVYFSQVVDGSDELLDLIGGTEGIVAFVEGLQSWLQAVFKQVEVEQNEYLLSFMSPNEVTHTSEWQHHMF